MAPQKDAKDREGVALKPRALSLSDLLTPIDRAVAPSAKRSYFFVFFFFFFFLGKPLDFEKLLVQRPNPATTKKIYSTLVP